MELVTTLDELFSLDFVMFNGKKIPTHYFENWMVRSLQDVLQKGKIYKCKN